MSCLKIRYKYLGVRIARKPWKRTERGALASSNIAIYKVHSLRKLYVVLCRRRQRGQSCSIENPALDSKNSKISTVQINEEDVTYLKWHQTPKIKKIKTEAYNTQNEV